jgi:hypothetical protein
MYLKRNFDTPVINMADRPRSNNNCFLNAFILFRYHMSVVIL